MKTAGTYRTAQLTESVIKAAQPLPPTAPTSAPRKVLLFDKQVKGFGISISGGGAKSYIVQRRVHGRQVRFAFRKVGEGTLQEARKEAERLLVEMSGGVDLVEQKRATAAEKKRKAAIGITLRDAWKLREMTLKARGRSERTVETDRYLIEKYLVGWLDRELISITREEVRSRHAAIASEIGRGRHSTEKWRKRKPGDGKATANKALRAFRATWSRAAREHPEIGICPVLNVDWYAQPVKKSPIGIDGLPDLASKIAAIKSNVRRDLWRMMLFTGLRRESACSIRWEHVDLDARTLHIPNPKGGVERAFTMPLAGYLVTMLEARWAEHAKLYVKDDLTKPWVFPSPDAASGHIEEPRDDTLPVTPHDCRRLFASVAESVDASPYSIKLLLNHALPGDVTSGYMRVDTERLRPVAGQIAARMIELCKPKEPEKGEANVVPISKGKRRTPGGRVATTT